MNIKHAYFEVRQGNDERADEILSSEAELVSEEERGVYLAHKIKLSFRVRFFL